MQINSALNSYATAAFDTARSTMKGLAQAAVPPQGAERAAKPEPKPEPVKTEPMKTEAPVASQQVTGQRKGVSLDAYA